MFKKITLAALAALTLSLPGIQAHTSTTLVSALATARNYATATAKNLRYGYPSTRAINAVKAKSLVAKRLASMATKPATTPLTQQNTAKLATPVIFTPVDVKKCNDDAAYEADYTAAYEASAASTTPIVKVPTETPTTVASVAQEENDGYIESMIAVPAMAVGLTQAPILDMSVTSGMATLPNLYENVIQPAIEVVTNIDPVVAGTVALGAALGIAAAYATCKYATNNGLADAAAAGFVTDATPAANLADITTTPVNAAEVKAEADYQAAYDAAIEASATQPEELGLIRKTLAQAFQKGSSFINAHGKTIAKLILAAGVGYCCYTYGFEVLELMKNHFTAALEMQEACQNPNWLEGILAANQCA